jgi:hypothetical protein
MTAGWYGIDLDGTLARDDEGLLKGEIGSPVPEMVRFVKKLHGHGIEVRIMTARASNMTDREKKTLQSWLLEHIGFIPRITNSKDYDMVRLYDDRAVGIKPNTGRREDGKQL